MPGFWRKCRITFRWFRFAVWLVVLAALATLLWLNRVGLPSFLKTDLVATLHERGVALEFSRMRLHLVHGVVTENVHIGQPKSEKSPALSAREVQLRLNIPALLHRRFQVDGLVLRDGKLTLPQSPTNRLSLTNLQAELRFSTNDTWSLDNFSAHFRGVRILFSGEVTHATEVRHWDWKKLSSSATSASSTSGGTGDGLRNFSNTLAAIKFGRESQLTLHLTGDGNDVNSFALRGELALTNTVARGWSVDRLRTHFSYSNHVWRVPDLDLMQARTRLRLAGEVDMATKDFHGRAGGSMDAASVRPFLTTSNEVRGFQHLSFHDPLTLTLEAAGNLTNFHQLAAGGRLGLKNFAIREQTVDTLAADFTYSNLTAEFFHPQITRANGAQTFAVEKLTLDIAGQKLIFAGGAGNVDPAVVGRAIGPKTAVAMAPYQFLAIPTAQVNGIVPLRHDADGELVITDADMRFYIIGDTPFRWRRFETPRIRGTIHWLGNYLILTNAVAETYGGTTRGWGKFDLKTPGAGTEFSFFMSGTNADLHRMGLALWSPTNMLEGVLSGEIMVTSANSDDWRTWNGFGALKMREGLLWNVPIFGLISPLLNKLTPGWGNNRATEAAGQFTMTNGVIYTDSLKIHTALAQLAYFGTVDLAENVNARVTAQLMRSTPLFGSLFSTVLWPVSKAFECKVTGTLGQPKPTPIYIPKLLLMPLHPIQSLEELLPSSEKPKG